MDCTKEHYVPTLRGGPMGLLKVKLQILLFMTPFILRSDAKHRVAKDELV